MTQLEALARRVIEAPSPEAERAFRAELSGLADRQVLREFGEQFFADPEVSIPTFERLVELAPEDLEARVALGSAFWQMGEDDEARRHLEKARALEPEHLQVLTLEAALTEEPARRIQLYRRILEKEPSNEVARSQLPYLMLEEPAQRLLDTHEPAAQQDFLEAVSRQQERAPLWTLFLKFRYDMEVSLPALQRILELNPEDIEAQAELGLLLAEAGRQEAAARHLKKARALNPTHPSVLMLEASLTPDPAARIHLYRRVLAQEPGHWDALRRLRQLGQEP